MFKLVIMDLFIPTDREGFLLLDELVKLSKMNDCQTVIGVMTASSKREHRQLCMKKGADFYIEKVEDWQQELIDYCEKIKKRGLFYLRPRFCFRLCFLLSLLRLPVHGHLRIIFVKYCIHELWPCALRQLTLLLFQCCFCL